MKNIIKDDSSESRGNYLSINISNLIQPWLNFSFRKRKLKVWNLTNAVANWKDPLQHRGRAEPYTPQAAHQVVLGGHLHLTEPAVMLEGTCRTLILILDAMWLFPWHSRLGPLLGGTLPLPAVLPNGNCLVTCPSLSLVRVPQGEGQWCKYLLCLLHWT